jgi:hypothetical protein
MPDEYGDLTEQELIDMGAGGFTTVGEPVDMWRNLGMPGGFDQNAYDKQMKGINAEWDRQIKNSPTTIYNNRTTTPTINNRTGSGLRSAYSTAKNTSTGVPSVMSTTGSYTANQLPTYKPSTLLSPETFTAPLRDTHKVASYTQEAAAPGFAKLNRNANSIAARVNDPYSPRGRTTLRAALAGVGEGYGSVIEGAGKSGLSRYNSEYDSDYKTALLNNQSTNQFRQAQNQNTIAADQANYQAELNRIWNIANAEAKNEAAEESIPDNSFWGKYGGNS